MQEKYARAYVYDWVEVNLSEVYDSDRERHTKEIGDLLLQKKFQLNGIRETLKNHSACLQFPSEISKERLKRNGFRKLPVSIERKR